MPDRKDERSLGELFSDLASETSALVRKEVQLAKVELSQKAAEVGKQVGMIGLGGAVAYVGIMAIVAAIILLIGKYIPHWLSALLVGLLVTGIGYILSQRHLSALKRLDPVPRATVETLQEDKQWAKEQMR